MWIRPRSRRAWPGSGRWGGAAGCNASRCRLCDAIFTASMPAGVAALPKYDASCASMITLLRYGAGVPHYRIEGLQASLYVSLLTVEWSATQWDIVSKAGPAPRTAFQELIRQVRTGAAATQRRHAHEGAQPDGRGYMADSDGDSDDARTLRPLQAAAWPLQGVSNRLRPTCRAERCSRCKARCRAMPRSPGRCALTSRGSPGTPPCAAAPTSASGWSSFPAPSGVQRWPTNGCSATAAGQVVLKLKIAWREGTTHIAMSPLTFMQRLAALAPRPSQAARTAGRRASTGPGCSSGSSRSIWSTARTAVVNSRSSRPSSSRGLSSGSSRTWGCKPGGHPGRLHAAICNTLRDGAPGCGDWLRLARAEPCEGLRIARGLPDAGSAFSPGSEPAVAQVAVGDPETPTSSTPARAHASLQCVRTWRLKSYSPQLFAIAANGKDHFADSDEGVLDWHVHGLLLVEIRADPLPKRKPRLIQAANEINLGSIQRDHRRVTKVHHHPFG